VNRLTQVKHDFIPADCKEESETEEEEAQPKCEWDSKCCMLSCNDWSATSSKWLPKTWSKELAKVGLNQCEINAIRVNWWRGELEFNGQKSGVCAGNLHDDCGTKRGNDDNKPGTIPQQATFFSEVKSSLSGADCSKSSAEFFDARPHGYVVGPNWSTAALAGAAAFLSVVLFTVVRVRRSRLHQARHQELTESGTESQI